MTSPTENSMEAIAGLLAERQRYEGWLATLETRRATTPPAVYTRVRGDYEGRLHGVMEQLAGRTSELEQTVAQLAQRVGELKRDEDGKREERAEAELRALVGEYSPEQWTTLSQVSDAEISDFEARRGEVGSELAQVQDLLAQATARRPAPAVEPAHVEPPKPEPVRAEPAPDAPAAAMPGAAAAAPPPSDAALKSTLSEFDELAFLKSVVDRQTGSQPVIEETAENGARRDEPAASAPASASNAAAAQSFAPPPPPAPSRSSNARRMTTPPLGSPITSDSRGGGTADSRRMNDSVPSFLKDVPSEQVKTLKCQECGTLNYPTEWYCERCGGELAAM